MVKKTGIMSERKWQNLAKRHEIVESNNFHRDHSSSEVLKCGINARVYTSLSITILTFPMKMLSSLHNMKPLLHIFTYFSKSLS